MLEELVMEKELTKYDRTTTIHSIAVVTDLLNSKDKEFMQYYEKFKDANVPQVGECNFTDLKY